MQVQSYLYYLRVLDSSPILDWGFGSEAAASVIFPFRGDLITRGFSEEVIVHGQQTKKLVELKSGSSFTITMPNSSASVNLENLLQVRLYAQIMRHNQTTNAVTIIASGKIVGKEQSSNEMTTITGTDFLGEQDTSRSNITSECRHVLYGSGCKAIAARFLATARVTSIYGHHITLEHYVARGAGIKAIEETDKSYLFKGGNIQYLTDGGVSNHRISDAVEITAGIFEITISRTPKNLRAGVEIELFAGCAYTKEECVNKFVNISNFGGFPLPTSERVGAALTTGENKISYSNRFGNSSNSFASN